MANPDENMTVGATHMQRLKELAEAARKQVDAAMGPPVEAVGKLQVSGIIGQKVKLTLEFADGKKMRFEGIDKGIVGGEATAQGYYVGQMPKPGDEWSFQINGGASPVLGIKGLPDGFMELDFHPINPLKPQGSFFSVASGSQMSSMFNGGSGRWSKA